MQLDTTKIQSLFIQPKLNEWKYKLDETEKKAKSIFDLSDDQLIKIFDTLQNLYNGIESTDAKPKGYRVVICQKGNNPFEVSVFSYGSRKSDTEIPMPPQPKSKEECAFCKNISTEQVYKKYDDAIPEKYRSYVRCIMSKQENPLYISHDHAKHFFETSTATKVAGLRAVQSGLERNKKEQGSTVNGYSITINCGADNDEGGHQNYGHTHWNVDAGLNGDIQKVFQNFLDELFEDAKRLGILEGAIDKIKELAGVRLKKPL